MVKNREELCRILQNFISPVITLKEVLNPPWLYKNEKINVVVVFLNSDNIYRDPRLSKKYRLLRKLYSPEKTAIEEIRKSRILYLSNVKLSEVKPLLESEYTISVVSSESELEAVRSLGNIVSITSVEFEKVPDKLKRTVEYYKVYRELKRGSKISYKVPWAVFLKSWNRYTVTVLHHPSVKDQVLNFLTKWRSNRNKIRSILTVSGLLYSCQ